MFVGSRHRSACHHGPSDPTQQVQGEEGQEDRFVIIEWHVDNTMAVSDIDSEKGVKVSRTKRHSISLRLNQPRDSSLARNRVLSLGTGCGTPLHVIWY